MVQALVLKRHYHADILGPRSGPKFSTPSHKSSYPAHPQLATAIPLHQPPSLPDNIRPPIPAFHT
ncbi:hypothetical protein EDP1_3268 [Pseudomonas putida S610]|nr:hypothetical protein EDP1_3268 [Pseudomonas putida S610]